MWQLWAWLFFYFLIEWTLLLLLLLLLPLLLLLLLFRLRLWFKINNRNLFSVSTVTSKRVLPTLLLPQMPRNLPKHHKTSLYRDRAYFFCSVFSSVIQDLLSYLSQYLIVSQTGVPWLSAHQRPMGWESQRPPACEASSPSLWNPSCPTPSSGESHFPWLSKFSITWSSAWWWVAPSRIGVGQGNVW